jgi:hypothetical protein
MSTVFSNKIARLKWRNCILLFKEDVSKRMGKRIQILRSPKAYAPDVALQAKPLHIYPRLTPPSEQPLRGLEIALSQWTGFFTNSFHSCYSLDKKQVCFRVDRLSRPYTPQAYTMCWNVTVPPGVPLLHEAASLRDFRLTKTKVFFLNCPALMVGSRPFLSHPSIRIWLINGMDC